MGNKTNITNVKNKEIDLTALQLVTGVLFEGL